MVARHSFGARLEKLTFEHDQESNAVRSRIIISAMSALCLSGCAAGWYRADSSDSDVERARVNCSEAALAQLPAVYAQVVTRHAYHTPVRTTCDQRGTRRTCVTSGGDYVPPETEVQDVNEDRRGQRITECMVRQGYRYRLWK